MPKESTRIVDPGPCFRMWRLRRLWHHTVTWRHRAHTDTSTDNKGHWQLTAARADDTER